MTHLQQVIQAFKALNFDVLEQLLDDSHSYMDVPKDVFLDKLRVSFKEHQENGLKEYDQVLKGTCGSCYIGCNAYSFSKEGYPFLNLYFNVEQERITDIHLCHKILGLKEKVNEYDIYFKFDEEEKVDFKPSIEYLIDKQKADQAVEDFKTIASKPLIEVEDLAYWRDKYKDMVGPYGYGFNSPLDYYTYNAFFEFDEISSKVYDFAQAYDANDYCTNALEQYYNSVALEEREMVKWLFKHKDSLTYFNFNETSNWQKTAMVKLSKDSDMMVDCMACINALKFADIYTKEQEKLLEKYKPTSEHFDSNESIYYGLKNYLKLHGKYLDIIDEEED